MNGTLLHVPLVQCTPAHLYMECPVDPDHTAHHLTLLNFHQSPAPLNSFVFGEHLCLALNEDGNSSIVFLSRLRLAFGLNYQIHFSS